MVKEYFNGPDVTMKLHRSIAFYDGVPHWVEHPDPNGDKWKEISLTALKKGAKPFSILHTDPKLDTSAPELGYMNHRNTAWYLTRVPSRVQNQALRSENIWSQPRHIPGGYIITPDFSDSLLKKFPKLADAEAMILSLEWDKVAIHQHFAIGRKPDLTLGIYFQERLVGFKNPINDRYEIESTKNSSYVSRLLNKSGVLNV